MTMLAVHEALDQPAAEDDPVSADLVKLRYFVGLSMAEAAESLGLPLRSAERLWTFARAWLESNPAAQPALKNFRIRGRFHRKSPHYSE